MLGLVLEGGGAKGSYQAGALKAFSENNISFNGVMGTSIGSINGAIVAQDEIQKCTELWETLLPSMFTTLDDEKMFNLYARKFDRATIRYLLRTMRDFLSNRGLSIDRTMELLRELIDEDKVRNSPIDFGLVTISVTDRMPMEIFKEEIPYGMLHNYIMASAYHPTFKKELIDGKKYFDGGVYDNLPINPLIRRGYDEIIAIRTMSKMPHHAVIDDTVKVTYIIPSGKLASTINVHPQSIANNMNMGYFDTMRVIKNHKGHHFYFENITDSDFHQQLLSFSIPTFTALNQTLDLAPDTPHSETIDRLLKEIRTITKSPYTLSDYELFLVFLERYGKAFTLEKYKVYSLESYLQLLAEYARSLEKKHDSTNIINRLKSTLTNNKSNRLFNDIINNYLGA